MMADMAKPKKEAWKRASWWNKENDGDDGQSARSHGLDHGTAKSKKPPPLPFPINYQPSSVPSYVDTAVKMVDVLKRPMIAARIFTAMLLITAEAKKEQIVIS